MGADVDTQSSSFGFLAAHGPLYLRLATAAERTLAIDPSLTLVSLRQLAEAFAREAGARIGLVEGTRDAGANQLELLRGLEARGVVRDHIAALFHQQGKIRSAPVALPPMREQQAIVAHLQRAFALVMR